MGTVSLPLGAGNSGSNDWADVYNNDTAITDVLNGSVDSDNLAANCIGPNELTSALATDLGIDQTSNVRRGVTSIATEETTTSTSYTTLTTPDQVANVVLPTDGLLFVMYRALWKLTGASNSGAVALFLGSNQLKDPATNSAPAVQEGSLPSTGDNYGLMITQSGSGVSGSQSVTSDSSYVTTGMLLDDPLSIEAAAGTYTVSVQFHVNASNGGTLSLKERKLWVWTMGF